MARAKRKREEEGQSFSAKQRTSITASRLSANNGKDSAVVRFSPPAKFISQVLNIKTHMHMVLFYFRSD